MTNTNLDLITQIQLMSGGYYVSRCLQVVAELGIADLISDLPISAAELARSTGSNPDALARVLSLLCAHGVFVRVDGRFGHTEASRILRTDHPMSMRPFARMFEIPVLWQSVMRLDESVATGRPMGEEVTEGGIWHYLEQHPDANEKFNHAMAAKAQAVIPLVVNAYDFTKFARIADIAGGRGHLLSAILESSPLSRGILFDQPHVLEQAAGVASHRLELCGGNFFEGELPEADAYVLMEVIHDWDEQHAEKILRAVRRAAPVGARLLLVEAMMPEQPIPCWTTILDVVMLNLLGGRQRSMSEYLTLLNRCGFGQVQEIPVGAGHSIVEAVLDSTHSA
jgi:O-methyltransferase domain